MLRCTRQIHQIQEFPDKFKLFYVGCTVESWLFLISRLWSLSTSIIDSPHNFSSFFLIYGFLEVAISCSMPNWDICLGATSCFLHHYKHLVLFSLSKKYWLLGAFEDLESWTLLPFVLRTYHPIFLHQVFSSSFSLRICTFLGHSTCFDNVVIWRVYTDLHLGSSCIFKGVHGPPHS